MFTCGVLDVKPSAVPANCVLGLTCAHWRAWWCLQQQYQHLGPPETHCEPDEIPSHLQGAVEQQLTLPLLVLLGQQLRTIT